MSNLNIAIKTQNLGKKFQREWIFKGLDFEFFYGKSYAIVGSNGSGKSTLLQILAGFMPYSVGELNYFNPQGGSVEPSSFYNHLAIATPYLELIEEYTLKEFLNFHFYFKKINVNIDIDRLISIMYLEKSRNKPIRNFSSGMKQRLKLGLAFFDESPVVLLDEPTMNLDSKGIDWYKTHLSQIVNKKLILICSNQDYEYELCDDVLNIEDFKI
ncbi:ABC transporter ATP-binding protein [Aureibacter tunicatorum]|uniref:ABC-type multidrug transport system ATPase subunit n=1 Tax=Aureibacter tunicatorum TaxID=866807 RepID=A0AAE4BVM8_9BACT|nr:ATP-binding cassette domain-containing protein [Aureibacter tunicatorum]MDR6242067.1 ABC-type multidrug transport system ATPase subunit [Aureibacter tunicatorum]BDD03642.1 ATP-binding protein [Aureibacter tunicatorum]